MNHEIYAARFRAREAFMRYAGVLGVGVGSKLTGGEVTAGDSIVVLVDRKLPARQVPRGEQIPPVFDGFPTDVRQPVLTVPPQRPVKGRPHGPPDWCRTGDVRWIEWPKIHELNLARQRTTPQKPTTRTRRGTADH